MRIANSLSGPMDNHKGYNYPAFDAHQLF